MLCSSFRLARFQLRTGESLWFWRFRQGCAQFDRILSSNWLTWEELACVFWSAGLDKDVQIGKGNPLCLLEYSPHNQRRTWKSPLWKGKRSYKLFGFHVSFWGCTFPRLGLQCIGSLQGKHSSHAHFVMRKNWVKARGKVLAGGRSSLERRCFVIASFMRSTQVLQRFLATFGVPWMELWCELSGWWPAVCSYLASILFCIDCLVWEKTLALHS